MDVKEFLDYFHSPKRVEMMGGAWESNGGILSDTYVHEVPWEFRYKYAETLIGIDFGCEFQNGRCVAERQDWLTMRAWKESGLGDPEVNFCCAACYITIGNLEIIQNDQSIINLIASLFDPDKRGFWRPEIGCILPHKYRSTMCLAGRCSFIQRKGRLPKEDFLKVFHFQNIVNTWRRQQKEQP